MSDVRQTTIRRGDVRQTTIRFGEDLYRRLEVASDLTGLPINSIVIVACTEWLERHRPDLAYGRRLPTTRTEGAVTDSEPLAGREFPAEPPAS